MTDSKKGTGATAHACRIRSGISTEAAGANTASVISGCPSCASGATNIRCPAAANSSAPPRHCPLAATRIGRGHSSMRPSRPCSAYSMHCDAQYFAPAPNSVSDCARTVREEIFGPCAHIAPFDKEEEAIAMANDTRYGLASTVWTTNLSRGHRVAHAMEVGISWVNCWFLRDLRTPFGGAKLSGIGREGGLHSLNFYSEPTNVCIKL